MIGAAVVGAIAELGKQWFTNKKAKIQAKSDKEIRLISADTNLDAGSTSDMKHSWKDEYQTVVYTLPVVTIFYGAITNDQELIDRMVEGVKALGQLPEWYQWIHMGIVVATFGLRTYKWIKSK